MFALRWWPPELTRKTEMIEYNLEAELKRCIKSMHSGYIPKKDADYIRGVMERCLKWITDPMPTERKNNEQNNEGYL